MERSPDRLEAVAGGKFVDVASAAAKLTWGMAVYARCFGIELPGSRNALRSFPKEAQSNGRSHRPELRHSKREQHAGRHKTSERCPVEPHHFPLPTDKRLDDNSHHFDIRKCEGVQCEGFRISAPHGRKLGHRGPMSGKPPGKEPGRVASPVRALWGFGGRGGCSERAEAGTGQHIASPGRLRTVPTSRPFGVFAGRRMVAAGRPLPAW